MRSLKCCRHVGRVCEALNAYCQVCLGSAQAQTERLGYWIAGGNIILQDNETRLDLLNNRAIAKTIVKIIQDTTEPITIGVHGDWGVGKSSVLAMIEEELNPDGKGASAVEDWDESEEDTWDDEIDAAGRDGVVTIRFNSWQY